MNSSVLKLLALSLAILLICAGLSAYVLYGQTKEGERLRSFRENIEAWDRLNRASASLDADGDSGQSDRERLSATLLQDENDTVAFLAYVDGLGEKTGVEVSASELKAVKTSEAGFDNIAATLTLRGSEAGVESMIALLEVLPYRSELKSLTLTRINGTAEAVVELLISVIE
jgi:hypothetical protein